MNTHNTPRPTRSRWLTLRSVSPLHAGTAVPELSAAYTAATSAAEDYLRGTGDTGRPHTHRAVENRAPGR